MPVTLVDNVKIYNTTTGTGAIVLSSPVPAYRGVEALTNGQVYSYSIQQGANYEYGRGTYLAAGQQLIRSPIASSTGGTALDLQPNAEVAFVALAEDIQNGPPALDLFADRNTITNNGSGVPDPTTQTTTFTAVPFNFTGTIAWSLADFDGTALTPVTDYLSSDIGASVTMTATAFTTGRGATGGVTVTATPPIGSGAVARSWTVVASIASPGPQGDPGVAANTFQSLIALKGASTTVYTTADIQGAAGITDGPLFFTAGDFTGRSDDENIIKADDTALSAGAWVRHGFLKSPYDPVLRDASGNVSLGFITSSPNALLAVQTTTGVGASRGILLEHYGDQPGQYALDIHQYQGAQNAITIHCYSDLNGATAGGIAMQIDATRAVGTMLVLKNSENPVTSPGTRGSFNFLDFLGYGASAPTVAADLATLTATMTLITYDPLNPLTHSGGLVVVAGTGALQTFKTTSLLDSLYAAEIYGTGRGAYISTTNDTGFTLGVVKNGTGNATVFLLANNGVGNSLMFTSAAFLQLSAFDYRGYLALNKATAPLVPLDVGGDGNFDGNVTVGAAATGVDSGKLALGSTTQTTVGAAGGASAQPATPLGYLIAYLGATPIKIPYHNL